MFSRQTYRALALVAGASLISACAFGAGGEITGFGGGATLGSGNGSHPTVGGSVSYLLGGGMRVFGEFSYVPLGSASATINEGGVSANASASGKFLNYGGGVDYSFGKSERFVPYMLVAVGGAHSVFSGSGSGTSGSTTVNVSLSEGGNAVTFGVGGGVRIYVGKHWGIKPEFRYTRFTDVSGGGGLNAFCYTGGIFYQFGK